MPKIEEGKENGDDNDEFIVVPNKKLKIEEDIHRTG
jgi:hypothetical protein